MNILITGSAGFIGSHLTERFLARGDSVIGIDNYLSGQSVNTELFLGHPNFTFIAGDVADGLPFGRRSDDGQLDWVLHFASPASPPHYIEHPIETLLAGAQGTHRALELAHRDGAKFLLASTSEVYGDPLIHPQPESYWGNVSSTGPRACYDESKRYAEAAVSSYRRKYGTDARIIRIFNTYGPRMRLNDGRVVTNFIWQALEGKPLTIYGDGSQTRSFQYVDDLVDGVERMMASSIAGPVNLGNPEEFTVRELAELVRALTDTSLPVVFEPSAEDDPQRRKPDIATARNELGWRPTIPLRAGLQRTIDHFRALTASFPVRDDIADHVGNEADVPAGRVAVERSRF